MGKLWNYLKSIFFCCRRDQEGAILYISFHLSSSKTIKSNQSGYNSKPVTQLEILIYTKLGEDLR